ncbi:hypothetical protein U1Q18_021431 [Sarracenia purpurea var. burkii]
MEGLRPGWAVKAIIVIVISSVLFRCVSATTNHSVGGHTGWDLASNLRAWAASTAFYAGDNLVFTYGPAHDVIEVNEADFTTCTTLNPINTYNDGETVVQLQEGGTTRYFFCGRPRHCSLGLKLEVQVLPRPSPSPGGSQPPSAGHGSEVNNRRPSPPPPPPHNSNQSPPPDHDFDPFAPPDDDDDDDDNRHACVPAPGRRCSGGVSHCKLGTGWVDASALFIRCTLLIAALAVFVVASQ